ncbi:hypothetical protein AWC17_00835 [Mycobacterium nebraskense]|uniref:ESX-1 secretion-associated protein EspA/EspE-like domain-containing protein n=1 Tax=Mycobacterium nebraskense TaxID=244292 RepID=A0A1X1ZY52_9MYCO|nr:hypothetical protein AWC17_00835 [Mycobacterium nebraskense]
MVNKFDSFIKGDPVRNMEFTKRMSGRLPANPTNAKKGVGDFGKAASLIMWTITIVEVLELTTGFGPPADGSDLEGGAQQFADLSAQLKSALPDDNWQGSASQAYADLDTTLQNMATSMAELDNQLAALVKDQAEWVDHMRLAFGILKDVLFAAFLIEMLMFMIPPSGPLAAKIFAGIVCGLGIAGALSFLGVLLNYSITNGQKADALAAQYTQLAAGAVQTGSLAQAKVATTGESSVSSFEAVSASMSGPAVTAAPVPAVAAPVKPRNGADDERAPVSAQMSAADTAAGATADAPTTPDQSTPSTPAAAMPTVAQLSAMSGQASKLSGKLSPHAQLVNQAMAQIQQLTQTAQQGQGTAAPAEPAATEEADVEGAGAGMGTEGTQRAPIEATAGAEAAPSRAGRVI